MAARWAAVSGFFKNRVQCLEGGTLFTFVRLERCLVYSRGSVIAVGRQMLPDCAGTRCGVGVGSLLAEIVARALTRVTNPLQASL